MKKFIPILLLFTVACSPNPPTPNTSYYFDCTVDGKHIRKDCCAGNMTANVSSQMYTIVEAQTCNDPGTYCFNHHLTILAQQTGNYTVNDFSLDITEGANTYSYIAYSFPPATPKGNINITISEINRTTHVFTGSFSGTVKRRFH